MSVRGGFFEIKGSSDYVHRFLVRFLVLVVFLYIFFCVIPKDVLMSSRSLITTSSPGKVSHLSYLFDNSWFRGINKLLDLDLDGFKLKGKGDKLPPSAKADLKVFGAFMFKALLFVCTCAWLKVLVHELKRFASNLVAKASVLSKRISLEIAEKINSLSSYLDSVRSLEILV